MAPDARCRRCLATHGVPDQRSLSVTAACGLLEAGNSPVQSCIPGMCNKPQVFLACVSPRILCLPPGMMKLHRDREGTAMIVIAGQMVGSPSSCTAPLLPPPPPPPPLVLLAGHTGGESDTSRKPSGV